MRSNKEYPCAVSAATGPNKDCQYTLDYSKRGAGLEDEKRTAFARTYEESVGRTLVKVGRPGCLGRPGVYEVFMDES